MATFERNRQDAHLLEFEPELGPIEFDVNNSSNFRPTDIAIELEDLIVNFVD